MDKYHWTVIFRLAIISPNSEILMNQNNPSLNKQVRAIYEPRYERKLSDKEVWEIEHNLKAYAEVILRIASQVENPLAQ